MFAVYSITYCVPVCALKPGGMFDVFLWNAPPLFGLNRLHFSSFYRNALRFLSLKPLN